MPLLGRLPIAGWHIRLLWEIPVSRDLPSTGLGPLLSTWDPRLVLVTQLGETSEGWGSSTDLQSCLWLPAGMAWRWAGTVHPFATLAYV